MLIQTITKVHKHNNINAGTRTGRQVCVNTARLKVGKVGHAQIPLRKLPYFRDQTPHSISGHPRIIAAPPEGLNEINAALV